MRFLPFSSLYTVYTVRTMHNRLSQPRRNSRRPKSEAPRDQRRRATGFGGKLQPNSIQVTRLAHEPQLPDKLPSAKRPKHRYVPAARVNGHVGLPDDGHGGVQGRYLSQCINHFLPMTLGHFLLQLHSVSYTSPPRLTFRLSCQEKNGKEEQEKDRTVFGTSPALDNLCDPSKEYRHPKSIAFRLVGQCLHQFPLRWPLRRHTRIRISIASDHQTRHDIRATQGILHRLLRALRIDYHTRNQYSKFFTSVSPDRDRCRNDRKRRLTTLRPHPSIDPHITRPARLQVRIHEHARRRTIIIDEEVVDLIRAVAAEVVFKSHIGASHGVEDALLRIRGPNEV